MAESIVFSWEGTVMPLLSDDDPWDVGETKPFFVSVTLDTVATDFSDDVNLAIFPSIFDLVDMEFRIDGALASDTQDYSVIFTDGTALDQIDIRLNDVFFNGAFGNFGTQVVLPDSTFTFDESLEFPPAFFARTQRPGLGVATRGDSASYSSLTQAGIGVSGRVIGEPADLTGDGFVDFDDLTILLAHWDQRVAAGQGNLVDPLGTPIDFQDLTFLLADWTGPGPVAAPEAAVGEEAVPEPSTFLLAILAVLGAGISLRRNRKR
ncbi:MAG: PEP-CTERM sorting domain-containing protein [Planctomycetes bacterium]|nr:PEP-CTERM sorting domain-containing protein [Planctomycetota bacterium]